jgi:hypothetical protein
MCLAKDGVRSIEKQLNKIHIILYGVAVYAFWRL